LDKIIDLLRKDDSIHVYSIDRFSRNLEYGTSALKSIVNIGAKLFVVNENLDSKSAIQQANILRGIIDAELQSKQLSEKVILAARLHQPYGYTHVPGSKVYEKNNEEYPILQRIIHSTNLDTLVNELNRKKITKRGKPWTYGNMKHALQEHERILIDIEYGLIQLRGASAPAATRS
jgi:DNA invertase Pin-like site-specific DNA recombinase